MTAAPVSAPPAPIDPARERLRAQLHRWGLIIAIVGIALFVPLLATAALVQPWRIPAAFATLGAWVVWKIGRAMMKLNAPA